MTQHPTPPTQVPQRPGCTCTRHSDTDTHPALCRGWHRDTQTWCTRHKGTVKCGGGGHTLSRGDSKQGVTRVRHKHRKVAHHTDSPTRSPVGKGQSVRAGRHGQCNNPGRPPSREEATGQQGKSGARRTDNAKARGRHTSSGWSRRDVVSCELQDARQQRRGGGARAEVTHRTQAKQRGGRSHHEGQS